MSPSNFTGLWYLLVAAVAFGFLWAGIERSFLCLLDRNPALRESIAHTIEALSAKGKNFDFTRKFRLSLDRTTSIFIRDKTKGAKAGEDWREDAPAGAELEKESRTEKAARLAVEKYEREKRRERNTRKVGSLW